MDPLINEVVRMFAVFLSYLYSLVSCAMCGCENIEYKKNCIHVITMQTHKHNFPSIRIQKWNVLSHFFSKFLIFVPS